MIRVQEWECEECGYIVTGPRPPVRCPECSAPRDSFELLDDEDEYESDFDDEPLDDEDLDDDELDFDDLELDEDWDDEDDE